MTAADLSRFPPPARRPFGLRLLYAVPLLGWMLRDAAEGGEAALLWFIFNCVALLGLAIVIFGYPALIIAALAATAGMLTMLVLIANAK